VDFSPQRISYAKENYQTEGITFIKRDIRDTLDDLGPFDFIWIRFVLEYYRSSNFNIVKHISQFLKPGGTLCLIDLDHNCLSHYGLSKRLEKNIFQIMKLLEKKGDFDPYAGRKLYSFLYDLDYKDIELNVTSHHLIFDSINEVDLYNWTKKVEVAGKDSGYEFTDYKKGYEGFVEEFNRDFTNPRRFTYTPIMWCKGIKP